MPHIHPVVGRSVSLSSVTVSIKFCFHGYLTQTAPASKSVWTCPNPLLPFSFVQISGHKMRSELVKLITIYNDLEEAGFTATLTLMTRGGNSSYMILLESLPSSQSSAISTSSTSSTATRLAPGAHRKSQATRQKTKDRAAEDQASSMEGPDTAGEEPSSPASCNWELFGRTPSLNVDGRLPTPYPHVTTPFPFNPFFLPGNKNDVTATTPN